MGAVTGRRHHGRARAPRGRGGPPFSEVVDCARAVIRARGCLTVQSADLLRGTVEVLRRSGHTRITVDLTGLTVAGQDALDLLSDLADEPAGRAARLVVLPPAEAAPPAPADAAG
jgi:anti-anti-sigma regulatory factor